MSVDPTRAIKAAAAQRLYDALACGDRGTLDTLLSPDFVGRAAEGMPLNMGGEHVGPDAMCANLWWRIGENFKARAQSHDFRVLDDGRLMVVGRYVGTARRSGNPLDAAFIHLIEFGDDGRIVRLDQLTDTAAWHAALGVAGVLQTIDYRVSHGVAELCLNRPDHRNAINMQMAQETLEVARRIAADSTVRAVLICGNGSALSVGGDIDFFLDGHTGQLGELLTAMTTPFHLAFDLLSRLDVPIVAAAHGAVAGGGLGYVYSADLVLADESTRFVTAFSALALSGDGGGTWHLPRLVGARRAAECYLRNRPISAAEALQWGLVNEIVPADELRSRATALARELADGPTLAYATMRRLLRDSWHNDLHTQLIAETDGLRRTGDSRDAAAAIPAFAARRQPQYTGR